MKQLMIEFVLALAITWAGLLAMDNATISQADALTVITNGR